MDRRHYVWHSSRCTLKVRPDELQRQLCYRGWPLSMRPKEIICPRERERKKERSDRPKREGNARTEVEKDRREMKITGGSWKGYLHPESAEKREESPRDADRWQNSPSHLKLTPHCNCSFHSRQSGMLSMHLRKKPKTPSLVRVWHHKAVSPHIFHRETSLDRFLLKPLRTTVS